jgi:hypothetical protein
VEAEEARNATGVFNGTHSEARWVHRRHFAKRAKRQIGWFVHTNSSHSNQVVKINLWEFFDHWLDHIRMPDHSGRGLTIVLAVAVLQWGGVPRRLSLLSGFSLESAQKVNRPRRLGTDRQPDRGQPERLCNFCWAVAR